jgi:aminopeptidase N
LRIIDAVDPDIGDVADASLAHQSEILDFLETQFARQYPFETAGAIVDDFAAGFALENQTRPVYDPFFFIFGLGDIVVVHELAHQWFGDDLALARWQDIWLNEGFATYAEWLWLEHEGAATAQELFFGNYQFTPPNSPFWQLKIGDPGPQALFAEPVYVRGAMTLHALRLVVGDATFFEILHRWADRYAGGNVTTAQFVELAEHVSHRQLDAFFDEWLNTAGRPDLPEAAGLAAASTDAQDAQVDAAADDVREWRRGLAERLVRGAR